MVDERSLRSVQADLESVQDDKQRRHELRYVTTRDPADAALVARGDYDDEEEVNDEDERRLKR